MSLSFQFIPKENPKESDILGQSRPNLDSNQSNLHENKPGKLHRGIVLLIIQFKQQGGTSLVVHPPVSGTRVPTCFGQLSLCTATTEARAAWSTCPSTRKAVTRSPHTPLDKEPPFATTREGPCSAMKTQHSQK